MSVVIQITNLSKIYRLGEIGTGTISRDLERWYRMRIRGQEDPFLKIGETNDRVKKGISDVVYSLRDINFEVQQGEALGIIGKNGAGKSTLLKILSRVTSPTTGKIHINGRVASLLEVGTGFHPELTGRENIFLNGAILGMQKNEITRKLDEIIDFSGVERYIDTPVKRYSSGMYVRLAFAVAAHLESEIMIVDEVLAVGDAEFQKKCLGKMGEVSKGEGKTILFVSHNMSAIRQLCSNGIVLVDGQEKYSGIIGDAVGFYLDTTRKIGLGRSFIKQKLEGKDVELVAAEILNENFNPGSAFDITEIIVIKLNIYCNRSIPRLYGYVAIKNSHDDLMVESDTFDHMPNCLENLKTGENIFYLKIVSHLLAVGEYRFYLSLASEYANNFLVDTPGDLLKFTLVDHSTQRGHRRTAKTSHLLKWELQHAIQ